MNIADSIERGRARDPQQPALIFDDIQFTYAELDQHVNRAANGLRGLGVGSGDRVGLFLPNMPEWVMVYLGLQKIGALAVSLSAALQSQEVSFMLNNSGAMAVVTTAALRDQVQDQDLPALRHILIAEGEASDADLDLHVMMDWASPEARALNHDRDHPAAIVYTSGTTGFPKGATLSHGNVVSNMAAKQRLLGITPADRLLLFMPLHHCFGQNAILNSGLGAGATIVLQRKFDLDDVLHAVARHGVTMFFGIPTVFILLYEKASPEALRSVSYYFSAAANLPMAIEHKWREKFGTVIHQGYGLTETSPFASYNHQTRHKAGSIGTPIDHVEMKIVDVETGGDLAPGVTGEIVIRGPNVMLGYWNCPQDTAQVIRDGWFHSGDLGRMDDEGYFYIEDRLKDMINVGGLKIYPAEVENVLYRHPAVVEAAVFGVPDDVLGEQVQAHVVLKPDQTATDVELIGFCRQHLAAFKVPRLVELVEKLPKNPTGKVLKRLLRDQQSAPVKTKTPPLALSPDLDSWLYDVDWQPRERVFTTPTCEAAPAGRWLIFADTNGFGAQLVAQLKARGATCVVVHPQGTPEALADDAQTVNPSDPADFSRLLQCYGGADVEPWRGIVFLWGLMTPALPAEPPLAAALDDWQTLGCDSVLHLVQALAQIDGNPCPRLWLVTHNGQPVGPAPQRIDVAQTPLWGLGHVIALEHPAWRCTRIDMDVESEAPTAAALVAELDQPDQEDQIAWRQGRRYVARLVRYLADNNSSHGFLSLPRHTPFQLHTSGYGTLENLFLQPMIRREPGRHEVEIHVHTAGLNFRDILHAMGMLPETAAAMPFGFECSGHIVALGPDVTGFAVGDPVLAVLTVGSMSSFVTVPEALVIAKPDGLTFEEAATVPLVFLTAIYGLEQLAKLTPGERVLIHAAAGGVGQAAVQLAQRLGADVYATASPDKWAFLKALGVQHVSNSRTLAFADTIMALTQGCGMDVVLNSLSGAFIPKTLDTLGLGGRFIEIGKRGVWTPEQVAARRPDVTYVAFDLHQVTRQRPEIVMPILRQLSQDLSQGRLRPLPHKVFPIQQAQQAFRYMAQARHIGKIVLSLDTASPPARAAQRQEISAARSYLVSGGLGALGLHVARWLVQRGAQHVILLSRRPATREVQSRLQPLASSGANIHVIAADVSHASEMAAVLQQLRATMPPLRGIIHAAGVLDDGVLLYQTQQRLAQVMRPKVLGAWNLHVLTQHQPLDFMVFFSSATALLGAIGQGPYAAANAFLDGLAHYRRAAGLTTHSINWGPWAEAGMAANLEPQHRSRLQAQGFTDLTPEQGLAILERILDQDLGHIGVLPVIWSRFMPAREGQRETPFLEALRQPVAPALAPLPAIRQAIDAAPEHQRHALLSAYIRTQVARVLGLDAAAPLSVRQEFSALGIDSLMAVELKNRLEDGLHCPLRATLVFDYPTIEAIAAYVMRHILPEEILPASPPPRSVPRHTDRHAVHVEALVETAAEALLLDELNKLNH